MRRLGQDDWPRKWLWIEGVHRALHRCFKGSIKTTPVEIDEERLEVFLSEHYRDGDSIDVATSRMSQVVSRVDEEIKALGPPNHARIDAFIRNLRDGPSTSECEKDWEYVEQVVNGLPQPQRQVLLLHVNDGLKNQQIGEQLGLSAETVIYELRRVRTYLLGVMKFIDPT